MAVIAFTGCRRENFHEGVYNGREIRGARIANIDSKCESHPASAGELICQTPIQLGDTTAYLSVFVSDMEDDYAGYASKAIETDNDNITSQKLAMRVFDHTGAIYVSSDEDLESPQTAEMKNVSLSYDNTDGIWKFDKSYYWPLDGKSLTFCTFAPDSVLNGPVPSVKDVEIYQGKLKLHYTQPSGKLTDSYGYIDDALEEKDLLVAMGTQSAGADGSVKVRFKHALTGVRFECGNLHGVAISAIALEGFYDSGTITLDPAGNDGKGSISWDCTGSSQRTFRQSFVEDGEEAVAVSTGASLDPDTKKSRTFMMIPQELDEDNASIVIELAGNTHTPKLKLCNLGTNNIGGGDPSTLSPEQIAENQEENRRRIKDWRAYAGKIITFRISLASNVNMVNVSITDEVDGLTKKNIVIRNDGTTPVFIRETLIGNWTNSSDKILASWDETNPYGVFKTEGDATVDFNIANTIPDRWAAKASSNSEDKGIYYYKRYLAPGATLKQNLFDTFTITKKPANTSGSWEGNVDMEIKKMQLNILVQAVSAVKVKDDGTWSESDYTLDRVKEAWGTDTPITTITADN